MRCEQCRQTGGVAIRHAAFSGNPVNPDMASCYGKPSRIARIVVVVDKPQVEFSLRAKH